MQNNPDYKKLFSELIKKQMLILGPDITLAKAKNVVGITVDINGEVQQIEGDPNVMLQNLINEFVELSGLIVKKTMESILTANNLGNLTGVNISANTTPAVITTDKTIPSASEQASSQVHLLQNSNAVSSETHPAVSSQSTFTNSPAQPEEDQNFTDAELADLNKALEELAKSPIEGEDEPSQAQKV